MRVHQLHVVRRVGVHGCIKKIPKRKKHNPHSSMPFSILQVVQKSKPKKPRQNQIHHQSPNNRKPLHTKTRERERGEAYRSRERDGEERLCHGLLETKRSELMVLHSYLCGVLLRCYQPIFKKSEPICIPTVQ